MNQQIPIGALVEQTKDLGMNDEACSYGIFPGIGLVLEWEVTQPHFPPGLLRVKVLWLLSGEKAWNWTDQLTILSHP